MIERSRRSISGSPGIGSSSEAGIVLTYGVLSDPIGPLPACWARSTTRVSRCRARLDAVVLDDGVERVEPFGGLDSVDVYARWGRIR